MRQRRALSDLLRLSESSETGLDGEAEEEVKKNVEALEELNRVVKRLQCDDDDVLRGAIDVRRLTKEDSEERMTLALLGAIPPLVASLDLNDLDSHITSLYQGRPCAKATKAIA
uniref:Putative Armadillo n=1 Tax=Davidia involucrata TaxID=16924 RepID=A0A5B7C240_DAVIN